MVSQRWVGHCNFSQYRAFLWRIHSFFWILISLPVFTIIAFVTSCAFLHSLITLIVVTTTWIGDAYRQRILGQCISATYPQHIPNIQSRMATLGNIQSMPKTFKKKLVNNIMLYFDDMIYSKTVAFWYLWSLFLLM